MDSIEEMTIRLEPIRSKKLHMLITSGTVSTSFPIKKNWSTLKELGFNDPKKAYAEAMEICLKMRYRVNAETLTVRQQLNIERRARLSNVLKRFVKKVFKLKEKDLGTITVYVVSPSPTANPTISTHLLQYKWSYSFGLVGYLHGFVIRGKKLLIVNRLNRKVLYEITVFPKSKRYLTLTCSIVELPETVKKGEKIW